MPILCLLNLSLLSKELTFVAITAAGFVLCGGRKNVFPYIIHSTDHILLLVL